MRDQKNRFYGALAVAMIASLPAIAPAASSVGSGSGTVAARAAIDFMIQVPRVMQMRLLGQPAAIDVTAEDIARGSIRVTGASVDLLVNDHLGYLIRADVAAGVFSAVKIVGLSSPVLATPGGAIITMASMVGKPKPAPMPVEYELQLSAGVQPGRYAWPLTLSLQQL